MPIDGFGDTMHAVLAAQRSATLPRSATFSESAPSATGAARSRAKRRASAACRGAATSWPRAGYDASGVAPSEPRRPYDAGAVATAELRGPYGPYGTNGTYGTCGMNGANGTNGGTLSLSHGRRGPGALAYAIQYVLAGRQQRAAMRTARADARFADAMRVFVERWSRRQVDEQPMRDGAKLLRAACQHVLDRGAAPDATSLLPIVRRCLEPVKDPETLWQLYDDLGDHARPARGLQDTLPARLRDVGRTVLDTVREALAESLAARIGTPLFGRLLKATALTADAARDVRATLEQLHGIAQWLSSPTRPGPRVLSRMMDILTHAELGKLVAQAWPDLSIQDERHGADLETLRAARGFLAICEGEALSTWRHALRLQLDSRKRVEAWQAARRVHRDIGVNRLTDAMRAAWRQLDTTALVLTGYMHNTSVLRARLRAEALALVLNRLPETLRSAALCALDARELSSIKASYDTPIDMPATQDVSLRDTVERVQADMLANDRGAVETALDKLEAALDRQDRTVAVSCLGDLGRALQSLCATQGAFQATMPERLTRAVQQALRGTRALIRNGGDIDPRTGMPRRHVDTYTFGPDSSPDFGPNFALGSDPESAYRDSADGDTARNDTLARDIHVLQSLSDNELGELRTASAALSNFGSLIDKRALDAAVHVRLGLPYSAHETMDGLLETLMDKQAGIADAFSRLRDVADVLVLLNRRRAVLGKALSADSNAELVASLITPALARFPQPERLQARAADGVAAMARRSELTGATLSGPLFLLANWYASQGQEETMRVTVCTARLTMASHLEQQLFAAIVDYGDRSRADAAIVDNGDRSPADAAIANDGDHSPADAAIVNDYDGSPADAAIVNKGDRSPAKRAVVSQRDKRQWAGPSMATPDHRDPELRAALAGQFGVRWDAARGAMVPCVTRAMHAAFEMHLTAPRLAATIPVHPTRIHAADGRPSWFFVSDRFARDVVARAGMSLAVEGWNARGLAVRYAGFPARLDQEARRDALCDALHALDELAGATMPALTQWLHGGIPQAFVAALSLSPDGVILEAPYGSPLRMPHTPPETTAFLVRREADGEYSIETVLSWPSVEALPAIAAATLVNAAVPTDAAISTPSTASATLATSSASPPLIPLDSTRSYVEASFTLAADARGTVYALRGTAEIRYRVAPRPDPRGGPTMAAKHP